MVPSEVHIRHCMLVFFNLKKNAVETKNLICEAYGDDVVSIDTCDRWFEQFKSGNFDLENISIEPCYEDPINIKNNLVTLLAEDPTLPMNELAKHLAVNYMTVSTCMQTLDKIYKEGKWVPRMLSGIAILDRYNICVSLLCRYSKKDFLSRVVIGDQKWIYLDDPDGRDLWTNRSQIVPNCKVLLYIWWDEEGMILSEILESSLTLDAHFYCRQLHRLAAVLCEKRPRYRSKQSKVILQSENIRPPCFVETVKDLGWEILPHPTNSPDLAPSYYHLFHPMQRDLKGKRFQNGDEVEIWLVSFLSFQVQTFYHDGIHCLPEKWQKVINSYGNYF